MKSNKQKELVNSRSKLPNCGALLTTRLIQALLIMATDSCIFNGQTHL